MKNQKGITLIALVITIIVLLILAGVSIAMLTGPNGILTQANDAKAESAKAEVRERINMELNAIYAKALAGDTTVTAEELAQINKNLNGKAEASGTTIVTITGAGMSGNVNLTTKTITPVQ